MLHVHLAPAVLPIVARGARLVLILIGIEVWKPLSPLQRYALRRAERLIGISRHTIDEFKRANPEFSEIEISVCHPGLPRTDKMESNIPSSGAALIVGRMAASERYKGHDVLLESWNEVVQEVPMARLLIVGEGNDRSRLEEKARALGLQEYVRFAGRVSSMELERLYGSSSFMVMPSRGEGFGFVFLEAMRQGLPVVAGIGSGSEIVEDCETGFVVDPDDRCSLVEAIVSLFRDEKLRCEMGARARSRFETNFTSEHFRERLRATLRI